MSNLIDQKPAGGFELGAAQPRRRGRPKGSGGKRRGDLAAYIAAQFGATPGEQMAKVALVSRKELRAAGGSMLEAMVGKARELAKAIGCTTAEAWALMAKERAELMSYVHQRMPQAVQVEGKGMAPAVLIVGHELGAGAPQLLDLEDDEYQVVSSPAPVEVSRLKSHDAQEALQFQGVEDVDAAPGE